VKVHARFALFAGAAACTALLSCGARLEADPLPDAAPLLAGRYQLLVRTDSPTLDKLVYEAAVRHLGTLLPIVESGPFTGAVELTFSSSTSAAPIGVGTGVGHTSGDWYSGHSTGVSLGLSTAGALTWQNSVMIVLVKDAEGRRLWSATCRHRGSLGFGNSGDNAGERASQRCLEAIAERLGTALGPPRSAAAER